MKVRTSSRLLIFLFVLSLTLVPGLAHAQTQTTSTLNTEASHMDSLAASQGQSKVVDKLSSDFGSFLGADSKTVITNLRNGTSFNLTTTTPGTTPTSAPVTTTTTINPPTGKMGWGNVYISLALAKQQLSQYGITQPTPQQLQAALTGGTITTGTGTTATTTQLKGVLSLRNDGMGWGQIAQKLGVKLGTVMSSLKSANHSLAAGATTSSTSTSSTAGSGITTGKGALSKGGSGEGIVTGSGRPTGTGSESGITTGSGRGYGVSGGGPDGAGQNGKGHAK
jgi:hypothetical protein